MPKRQCVCGLAVPSFGLPGETRKDARWCSKCPGKARDAVNVVSRRCECGRALPSFGLKGGERKDARWCAQCPGRAEGAVDVVNRRCVCGKTQPHFGLPQQAGMRKNAQWCASCPTRPPEAVDVISRRCACGRAQPNYGPAGEGRKGAKWCAKCPDKPPEAVGMWKRATSDGDTPKPVGRPRKSRLADLDPMMTLKLNLQQLQPGLAPGAGQHCSTGGELPADARAAGISLTQGVSAALGGGGGDGAGTVTGRGSSTGHRDDLESESESDVHRDGDSTKLWISPHHRDAQATQLPGGSPAAGAGGAHGGAPPAAPPAMTLSLGHPELAVDLQPQAGGGISLDDMLQQLPITVRAAAAAAMMMSSGAAPPSMLSTMAMDHRPVVLAMSQAHAAAAAAQAAAAHAAAANCFPAAALPPGDALGVLAAAPAPPQGILRLAGLHAPGPAGSSAPAGGSPGLAVPICGAPAGLGMQPVGGTVAMSMHLPVAGVAGACSPPGPGPARGDAIGVTPAGNAMQMGATGGLSINGLGLAGPGQLHAHLDRLGPGAAAVHLLGGGAGDAGHAAALLVAGGVGGGDAPGAMGVPSAGYWRAPAVQQTELLGAGVSTMPAPLIQDLHPRPEGPGPQATGALAIGKPTGHQPEEGSGGGRQ